MSGSPAAGLVRAWVDLYTRGLPAELRAARRDEVADDLWCEQEEAALAGRSGRSLGADRTMRLLFGVAADITWRLAQTKSVSAETLNRRSSMTTRALGLVALAAGLTWAVWLIAFVAIGAEIWNVPWTILIIFLGGIGFPLSAIGIAYQVQDRLGGLSAFGAVMMVIGAFVTVTDTGSSPVMLLLLFPLGSAILLWEVSGAGVVSRVVPIAQAATAIALAIAGVVGLPLDGGPTERARTALIFAPFVLSWVALGLSFVRPPQPESAGRGSTA